MKKAYPKLLFYSIVGTILFMLQGMSLAQVKIVKYVSGSGGILLSHSQNYFHSGTAGEALIGGKVSTNHFLYSGFWALPLQEPVDVENMDNVVIPTEFELYQNYPNPFNPTTMIVYDLPELSTVQITIYNIAGQRVRNLVNENEETPGHKSVVWDGRNDIGEKVSSGIYFYHAFINSHSTKNNITEEMFQKTMKMLLLK